MSVDDLLLQLRDPDPRRRVEAARLLDHTEQTSEVEAALREAARDHDADVRKAGLHSLACAECKPDGCLAPTSIDVMIDALLHDRSVRVRRWAAGVTMWGQAGRSEKMVAAHREVLTASGDRVLRERAATFLASCDVPRGDRPYREWVTEWRARIDELLLAA